jgi:Fur family transcriptional regulator, ferric uptake regulator
MASGVTGTRAGTSRKRDRGELRDELKEPLRAFLKEKHLHESKVRDLIVDTFLGMEDHMGLEALLGEVRRKNASVSPATVYRTMRLLVEAGLAHARDFGSGSTVYEVAAGKAHHDHLVCERCGVVVEFVDEEIEDLQEKVASKNGFELRRHRHELFGICESCRAR